MTQLLPLPFPTVGGAEGSKQETEPPRSKSLVLQRLLHDVGLHVKARQLETFHVIPTHCFCGSSDDPYELGGFSCLTESISALSCD